MLADKHVKLRVNMVHIVSAEYHKVEKKKCWMWSRFLQTVQMETILSGNRV